jgi:hypothetical protein
MVNLELYFLYINWSWGSKVPILPPSPILLDWRFHVTETIFLDHKDVVFGKTDFILTAFWWEMGKQGKSVWSKDITSVVTHSLVELRLNNQRIKLMAGCIDDKSGIILVR